MKDIITQTRTYRIFNNHSPVTLEQLKELIELARLSGSARNCQPWQYLPVVDKEKCAAIFPHLGWAGYLSDWKGPNQGQRPTGYILCFLNRNWLKGSDLEAHFDLGISTQNILIGATARGLGGCRIGAFSKNLAQLFSLPDYLELGHVLALGVPQETVVIEECKEQDIKYWRDERGIHHVPKRKLEDVLLSSSLFLK